MRPYAVMFFDLEGKPQVVVVEAASRALAKKEVGSDLDPGEEVVLCLPFERASADQDMEALYNVTKALDAMDGHGTFSQSLIAAIQFGVTLHQRCMSKKR